MNINTLKNCAVGDLKGSLLDFMNPVELAANTSESPPRCKIRNQNIHGQKPLERVAEEVGRSAGNVSITNGPYNIAGRPQIV